MRDMKSRAAANFPTPPNFRADRVLAAFAEPALRAGERYEELEISGQNFGDSIVTDVSIATARFSKINARGAKWRNLRLLDVALTGCDLANIAWSGAKLMRVEFSGCRLTGADFNECKFSDVRFADCRIDQSLFQSANLERCLFEKCDLASADFENAKLDKDVRGIIIDPSQTGDLMPALGVVVRPRAVDITAAH
jgi:uncharacterized protein YjbI with pentapeptide repeats